MDPEQQDVIKQSGISVSAKFCRCLEASDQKRLEICNMLLLCAGPILRSRDNPSYSASWYAFCVEILNIEFLLDWKMFWKNTFHKSFKVDREKFQWLSKIEA